MPVSNPSAAGRPRSDLHATVFAATLRTVHELGYVNATMDRIAAAAGVAKTTIYRRWPSKGSLITDCLVDTFGEVPLAGATRAEIVTSGVHFLVAKIGEPGVGAAFAGVFVEAISDPALREVLSTRLQDPYRLLLQEVLGQPEHRVLLLIDVLVGTMLHRMGMTGGPMGEADVAALTRMVLHLLDD
ncbi:TetR/AcrR family transcriptional regulator [Micromonospora sp. WMMD1102]|uniref:TetR/AcrR family transcriptional regulator n=1 Tax=Micromonospora sp. WMMD1102 TaxID=3016105 RepID=UPI0024157EE2|nr:TetR/AcrR family transcriptional regulator [Micromonospora sp. WMMD1102]MDG4788274.1 TetR/AcrR family transcriptional regulator [Micromonospora sp. WMMD1102]